MTFCLKISFKSTKQCKTLLSSPREIGIGYFLKKPAIVSVNNVLYASALVRFTACPGVKICKSSLHISVSRRGNFVVPPEIF